MARDGDTASGNGDDLQSIRGDIDALRSDLSALLDHVKKSGRSRLGDAGAAGAEKLDELRGDLEGSLAGLQEQGKQSVDQLEKIIRDKPLVSLLAAFGAGVLIARLLERR